MTATPERTDDTDIFSLFDYNIAYEIRLQRAGREILSPFHYFGGTDYEKDREFIDETTSLTRLGHERIEHIIEDRILRYSGEECRGLMFVSSTQEAVEFGSLLNGGYRTMPLTGKDSQKKAKCCCG